MAKEIHIIKRRGGAVQEFDERKVYASCYSACMSSHLSEGEAEFISDKVTKDVKKWMKGKKNLTSVQIFKQINKSIKKHDKNAAFMYHTHMDIG